MKVFSSKPNFFFLTADRSQTVLVTLSLSRHWTPAPGFCWRIPPPVVLHRGDINAHLSKQLRTFWRIIRVDPLIHCNRELDRRCSANDLKIRWTVSEQQRTRQFHFGVRMIDLFPWQKDAPTPRPETKAARNRADHAPFMCFNPVLTGLKHERGQVTHKLVVIK